MQICRISPDNFNINSLDGFSRTQIVNDVYRLTNGVLTLSNNPFVDDWSAERKTEKAEEILSGRFITYGAFIDGRCVGEIMLVPFLDNGRMIVDSFHVSSESRRHGIGRALFMEAKKEAKKHGATALYVSACSAKETIDFYMAMGCVISKNPIIAYTEDEPFDIQLECPL